MREDAPVIMASGLINTTSGLESTAKRDLLMSRDHRTEDP